MTRPPAFQPVTDEWGSTVSVEIHGELDLATAPRLETIVKSHKRASADGVDVAVVRGPRAVERLFAVMRLDRSLNLVEDPAEL